jgi:hypothetical protein
MIIDENIVEIYAFQVEEGMVLFFADDDTEQVWPIDLVCRESMMDLAKENPDMVNEYKHICEQVIIGSTSGGGKSLDWHEKVYRIKNLKAEREST